jgi:hypothetical protein
MKRTIKYNAWIPDLEIMLEDITLYGNGQMGYNEDDLRDALPKGCRLDYDLGGIFKNIIDEDGNEDIGWVASILFGEDWVWFEEGEFIPLQFTGKLSKDKKEIFEGAIINCVAFDPEFKDRTPYKNCLVKWDDNLLAFVYCPNLNINQPHQLLCYAQDIEIIEYKPELLK